VKILPDAGLPARTASRVHPEGVFEARFPETSTTFRYQVQIRHATGTFSFRDPYAFPPTLGDLDYHLFAEGKHEQIYRHLGAHPRVVDGVAGTLLRRLGAARGPRERGRRLQPLGRAPLRDAPKDTAGIWEIFLPTSGTGRSTSSRSARPAG
jgi:1,4-alpha-glucan branching enzyme